MLETVLKLGIDRVLLDALYRDRLRGLRNSAEEAGLSKSGSVEVVRARLIQHHILGDDDLSWEGIQSMTHKEIREVLKVFGIKSSGSHKERRQRLWLHLNFDSRRLTVERLAEMDRDTLQDLCQKLELRVTGNRKVLICLLYHSAAADDPTAVCLCAHRCTTKSSSLNTHTQHIVR